MKTQNLDKFFDLCAQEYGPWMVAAYKDLLPQYDAARLEDAARHLATSPEDFEGLANGEGWAEIGPDFQYLYDFHQHVFSGEAP